MSTVVISWSTTDTVYGTNYTHTRVRLLQAGNVIEQQFIPLPGASAIFNGLSAGLSYIGDICLSNSTGTVTDAAGVIGVGPFSLPLLFTLPKPVAATAVIS